MAQADPATRVQRVAVVTGAARGIGFEIARQLVAARRKVALLDGDGEGLRAAGAEFGSEPSNILALECDITNSSQVKRAIGAVQKQFGPVEILVNNAGWTLNKPFLDLSESECQRIIDINYTGVLHLCREALPSMIGQGWGRIVNVASDAARVGTPLEAVYAGAKAAVIGFTKSLAAETARNGITVNVVCPGTTDTPLLRSVLTGEQIGRRIKANPSGRIGTPLDVANAVVFFASEQAAYVNGQVLSVSGGITRVG